MEKEQYLMATRKWVETVVVEYSLCPFAWSSMTNGRLREEVITETELPAILTAMMAEIEQLDRLTEVESSLLTIPLAFAKFDDFLDALDRGNSVLEEFGYEGVYQLASFHPDYQFAGTQPNDAENYTNRSPFPVFHLIREAALSDAIDHYPNVERVPEENIKKMNQLGVQKLKALLKATYPH